jgi:hypothetical protein
MTGRATGEDGRPRASTPEITIIVQPKPVSPDTGFGFVMDIAQLIARWGNTDFCR